MSTPHPQLVHRALFGALVLLALLAAHAHAAPPCQPLGSKCPPPMNAETARGLGLGTGVRASAVSTSALAYNPAALALGRLYHIEGSVDYLPAVDTVALGAAAVDSSTSKVGAGLGLRGFLSGNQGLAGIDGRLSLAFPFSNAVSIGLGGRYINLDRDTTTTTAAGAKQTQSQELAEGFTMDASFRVMPSDAIHLAVASYNFPDLGSAYVPVLIDASAAFGIGKIATLGLDFITDLTSYDKPTYTIGGGVELLAADSLPLRAGYFVDLKRKLHAVSGGLGYTDRQVGVDFSLQQQVSGGDDTRILGAIRYYVQ